MVVIDYNKRFQKSIKKLPNNLKSRVKVIVRKIVENPSIGKPMRYQRKKTREVYLPPFRIAYAFNNEKIIFLDFYHKDKQ